MTGMRLEPDDLGPADHREAPWAAPARDVALLLGTDPSAGLTTTEVIDRRARIGANEIPPARPVPAWRRFLGHLADPLVYLLGAAIVISLVAWGAEGASGIPLDAIVIAIIVVANAIIGFLQEQRAEAAVAALQALTRQEATVVRDGVPARRSAADLVPGDVVLLAGGDVVPADARLVEATGLRTAEAAVTGESAPIDKSPEPVAVESALGDRTAMVYSGTVVVAGRARAVVTATGSATEIGRVAALLEATERQPTPMQREIEWVGRVLGGAVVVIAVVVVATLIVVDGLRTTAELVDALLIGISLAVAAVPEGLPAVLSVVLAIGVQRMSTRNALVKRLVSVEALGSATVICTDKTGTLTLNEMTVRRVVVTSAELGLSGAGYEPAGELLLDDRELTDPTVLDEVRRALTAAGLASDATVVADGERFVAVGDPTEAALVAAQMKAGLDPSAIDRRFQRVAEVAFSSERQRMVTLVADRDREGRTVLVVKGAPDRLLGQCRWEWRAGSLVELTGERRQWWHDVVDGLAGQALRTLAIAEHQVDRTEGELPIEVLADGDLVLLAIVGINDPPRVEARQAVDRAQRAGIRVAMITGDHPSTAAEIARELGIGRAEPDPGTRSSVVPPVVTGPELERIDDDELGTLVATTAVYARVAPDHKLRIVRALIDRGDVVAMTGDGVNDAPALRAADIGVAMGVTGSDVSKEAADMILADDNFATIVEAVGEGRAIFHNIRSFLRYLLSSNVGEVLTVFLGVIAADLIGLADVSDSQVTTPLLAVQILWINLVTDAGPALALGLDPAQPGLMARPPRGLSDRVIDRSMAVGIALIGLTMAVLTLLMLDLKLPGGLVDVERFVGQGDLETARTAAFTVLVLTQLFNTFNARSDRESIVGRLLINRWLLAAIALSLALQVAVVHLPWLNSPFGTAPLSLTDWAVAVVLASVVVVVSEARKSIARRHHEGAKGPPRPPQPRSRSGA